jgi:membrane-associated phospholipid phosphatase
LVIAAGASTAMAAVVYAAFVRTHLGHRLDNAALAGSHRTAGQQQVVDASQLHRITADSLAVVLIVLAVIGIVRRRPRLGLTVAATAGIAVIAADVLKKKILPRPFLVPSDASMPVNTFPSGHTVTALVCALALVLVVAPRWRGAAAVVAGSYGWITAAQVQTAGWHRPSDAVGAAFIAFAAVALAAAALARWRPVGPRPGEQQGSEPQSGQQRQDEQRQDEQRQDEQRQDEHRSGEHRSGEQQPRERRAGRHWWALIVLALVWLAAAAGGAVDAVRVLRFLHNSDDTGSFSATIQADAYRISVNLTVVVVVTVLMAMLLLIGGYDLDEPGLG